MNRRLLVVAVSAIFAGISFIFFKDICAEFYFVKGYQCRQTSFLDAVPYLILATIPAFYLPIYGRSAAAILLWIVYYTHVVSVLMIYPLLLGDAGFWDWLFLISIPVMYSAIAIIQKRRRFRIPKFRTSHKGFFLFIILTVVFAIYVVVSNFGFSFNAPSIEDVYGVRGDYIDKISTNVSTFSRYIITIAGFSVSPFAIIFGAVYVQKKNSIGWLLIFLGVVLSYSIYGAGGFKSIAFIPVVVYIAWIATRKIHHFGFSFAIFIPSAVILAYLVGFLFEDSPVFHHWYRRVFMVTGMNVSYLYDYMISNNLETLSNAPEKISRIYYGTIGSANSGLFGDGLARNIYFGNFLSSLLFLLILFGVDSLAQEIDSAIVSGMFVPTAYAISNSSITTVILTYGFLASFIFLLLYTGADRTNKYNENYSSYLRPPKK